MDSNNLSIQVQAQSKHSTLPLPLPDRSIKHKKMEIDFAIDDNSGCIHSGVVVCTISLNVFDSNTKTEVTTYLYTPSTNDPNDPRNSFKLVKPRSDGHNGQIRYFLLQDPALCFPTSSLDLFHRETSVSFS